MRRIFVTGGTGYLGGYACTRLLEGHDDVALDLLVRARDRETAVRKLWKGWQLHLDEATFQAMASRVRFITGDLTAPGLGLSAEDRAHVVEEAESVLHIAASLNRNSERACLNANLRGLLSVLNLARAAQDHHGLRRFSFVSTAAVAGQRWREIVTEDAAIEWDRRQYDPYARTKAFGEHMVHELLPEVSRLVFRPSSVLSDSRFPDTTQWDMVRAFCFFADLPALPWGPDIRQDLVPADYVGDAISTLHMRAQPRWDTYHLSAGTGSCTSKQIVDALLSGSDKTPPRFLRRLQGPFEGGVSAVEQLAPGRTTRRMATLLRVFLPYVTNDTVFDNGRIVAELGRAPATFTTYGAAMWRYARDHRFTYPYRDLDPERLAAIVHE